MITRRQILGGTAASLAAMLGSSPVRAENSYAKKELLLKAPDDVILKTLLVADGPVQIGSPLMVLQSRNAESFERRIEYALQSLSIYKRKLAIPRVSSNRATLGLETGEADHIRNLTEGIVHEIENPIGNVPQPDSKTIYKAQIDAADARAKYIEAAQAETEYAVNISDETDQIAALESELQEELQAIHDFIGALTIKAPSSGKFTAEIRVGMFAMKGDVIGRLNQ